LEEKKMRKLSVFVALLLIASIMLLATACGPKEPAPTEGATPGPAPTEGTPEPKPAEPVEIPKLRIAYVPSMDVELILETTEPLKQLLIDELANHNFDVKEVEITVGTSFEAVGEALSAGSADIGFSSALVYITYDDEVDLLLTAARYDFKESSMDPMVWNKGLAERDDTKQVTGYPGLIYAGPSEYGKMLAAKVEAGEELTWEDMDGAVWAVANTSSNAGYLYPSLWLRDRFGKMISDLSNVLPGTAYPQMFAQAANETVDVFVCYADGRSGYEDQWLGELGRDKPIEEEVKVIGVTDWITNDVVIGSLVSDTMMTEGFRQAFCDSLVAISQTEAGFEAIQIFSHVGYLPGVDSEYDAMRAAQEILRDLE
jgi:phosphonate transport system substrate-binding protein